MSSMEGLSEDLYQWMFLQDPAGRKLGKVQLIQSVLDRCTQRLVEDMSPHTVLDRFLQDEIGTYVQVRDITELTTTSEKNRAIRDSIRRQPDTYVKFKEILRDTMQPYLAEYLSEKEKGVHNQMTDLGYQCTCTEDRCCELLAALHIDINTLYNSSPLNDKDSSTLRELQNHLVGIYNTHYCQLPINPLTPEIVEPLQNLYVKQSLCIEEHTPRSKTPDKEENESETLSLRDVFLPSSDRLPKQLYLKGESGTGKTAFCKHVISTWCHMIVKTNNNEQLDDDELVVSKFDLVFYITLKDFRASGDINSMIKQFLKRDVSDHFSQWRCLIILDGLDSWTLPSTHTSPAWEAKGVPIRDYQNRFIVLTTTRAWNLVDVKLRSTDIDRLITITGINEEQQHELLLKLLSVLCKGLPERNTKDIGDFFGTLNSSGLKPLTTNPAILKMLFCLWFGNDRIGKSYSEANFNLLERFLGYTDKGCKQSECQIEITVLEKSVLFKKNFYKHYFKFLKDIGYFAFHNLISKIKECPNDETGLQNLLSNESTVFGLETGLLTNSEHYDMALERTSSTKFIHKPFEDILTAFYIAVSEENVLFKMFDVLDTIDKVLEIEHMLMLLCGINHKLCGKLTSNIMKILDSDEYIHNYRCSSVKTPTESGFSYIKKLQSLVAKIALESLTHGASTPNARLFDIVLDRYMNQDIFMMFNTRFLKSVYIKTDILETDVTNDDVYFNFFKTVKDSCQIQKIHIDDSRKILNVRDVFGLISQSYNTIRCLCLEWINLDELDQSFHLVLGKMFLKSFSLRYVKLSKKQLKYLQACVNEYTELEELELKEIRCSDCPPSKCQYSIVLNEEIQPQRLHLSGLDAETVRFPIQKLTSLEIGYMTKSTAMKYLFTSFNERNNLVNLRISDCVDTEYIVGILPYMTELKNLHISRTDLGEHLLVIPPSITSIRLDAVTLCRKSAIAMLESIDAIDHRVYVDMFKVASEKELLIISTILKRFLNNFVIVKDTSEVISFYTTKSL